MKRSGHGIDAGRDGTSQSRATSRTDVAVQERGEDWLLPGALLGGLALAVLFNTFVSLMPG